MAAATRLYPGDHTGEISEQTRDDLLNADGEMDLDSVIPDPLNLVESFHSRYEEPLSQLSNEEAMGVRHQRIVDVEIPEAQDVFEMSPGYGLK